MVKRGSIGRTKAFGNRKRFELIINRYLRDCFDRHDVVRASELASLLGGDRSYVSDVIRATFGKTLMALLRKGQLEHAAGLLILTALRIDEVALASGFGNRSTFFRQFRQAFGLTPTEYRRKNQQNATLRKHFRRLL